MELVKWIALVSMTIDHINRFFYASSIQTLYCIGRLAMPLFAFIFAYNLARPDALPRGLYSKVLVRLVIFGAIATPGYIAMRHLQFIWPLNILFTLGVATATLYCFALGGNRNRVFAIFIFLIGGFFVEYSWVGIFFCVTAWFYCKNPTLLRLLACAVAYFFLDDINANHWALVSLAVILLATQIDIRIPRIRHFFYFYYPLHLYTLYFLSKWL